MSHFMERLSAKQFLQLPGHPPGLCEAGPGFLETPSLQSDQGTSRASCSLPPRYSLERWGQASLTQTTYPCSCLQSPPAASAVPEEGEGEVLHAGLCRRNPWGSRERISIFQICPVAQTSPSHSSLHPGVKRHASLGPGWGGTRRAARRRGGGKGGHPWAFLNLLPQPSLTVSSKTTFQHCQKLTLACLAKEPSSGLPCQPAQGKECPGAQPASFCDKETKI